MPGSDHYFSKEPGSASRPASFEVELLGRRLRLSTDAGVFSRARVDRGTRLLIEHAPLPERGTALDLGCGYGVVGLAVAAARPEVTVYMVDINRRAVELARRNAVANGLANVAIFEGDGFAALRDETVFDLIISNPPFRAGKRLVYGWVEQSLSRLRPEGALALVAQTKQGAKSLRAHVESVFGNVAEAALEGGYRVLVARRRSSGRGDLS